jgi:hypothetical protein
LSRQIKHRSFDKYDGYMPNIPSFVHEDYAVGAESEKFHNPIGYSGFYKRGHRFLGGFSFGSQKRLWHASPKGIDIDSYNVGKSEY